MTAQAGAATVASDDGLVCPTCGHLQSTHGIAEDGLPYCHAFPTCGCDEGLVQALCAHPTKPCPGIFCSCGCPRCHHAQAEASLVAPEET